MTVSDVAFNRFQMAVYATKHASQTNQTIEAHELDSTISGLRGKLKTRRARLSPHSQLVD